MIFFKFVMMIWERIIIPSTFLKGIRVLSHMADVKNNISIGRGFFKGKIFAVLLALLFFSNIGCRNIHCVKGNCKEGYGIYSLPDGLRYEGEWKDKMYHGQGTIINPDGTRYEGQFEAGMKNGLGKMTYADGRIYDGQWKDDQRNGEGTCTFPGGTEYKGEWSNDQHERSGLYKIC